MLSGAAKSKHKKKKKEAVEIIEGMMMDTRGWSFVEKGSWS